ncbi:Asp23/Gls24 family envelope stress response protein [Mycobacterium sp. DL]|uniref:Asp23/Gls24 family envelope stress response protein n=1 Tax=Mycobacteriaceae TaxID=1762 RepID=UPI00321AF27B
MDNVPDRAGASVGADSDPGERGALTVRDKVAQRIAMQAAVDTPGVQRHAAGLDKLTGRELPRVRVDISATRVRAHLTIAVTWPQSLTDVGNAVQRNVSQALTDSSGFQVDGVDVAIETLVAAADEHSRTVL